ncbi:MAG: hypothetical protein GF398_05680 [Chitinivibrionales bacterium]|nr:hypothetical protein [Chitinivibrionales bacterium]
MKALKVIFVTLIVIVVLAALVGLFLPSKFKVERSIVIKAPADIIFENVNDLKKAEKWNAWMSQDTTMKITYGEKTAGVGATSSWTSKHSGSGSQKIIESDRPTGTKTHLDFGSMGTATGYFNFEETSSGTKVTNGFYGDYGMNLMGRYFGLGLEGMVGPYFEKGLTKLKEISEQEARQAEAMKAQEAEADSLQAEASERAE